MINDAKLSALIARIYDAGVDPACWPDTLGHIADACGATSAGMTIQGRKPADCSGLTVRLDPAFMASYIAHFHSVNPIWSRVSRAPAGTVQTDSMILARREFSRTEFFNDFLVPQGTAAMLNAVVLVEEGRQTVVTVHGPRAFDSEDIRLYELITPHLQRAVQLNARLADLEIGRSAYAEALNQLTEGVLLVDATAHVLFANEAAEKLFGPGLRFGGRVFRAAATAETALLHARIARSACFATDVPAEGPLALSRGSGRAPLAALVIPFRSEALWPSRPNPAAIVFLTDPDSTPAQGAAPLRKLFGLTPAETAVALEVSNGKGLRACADKLGVSLGTVRTHLGRVFEKTNTRRQAELVGLLLKTQHRVC